jgi:hypothetical protein
MGLDAIRYVLDTTIHPDNSLEKPPPQFRAAPARAFLGVNFPALKITAVTADAIRPYFQTEASPAGSMPGRALIIFRPPAPETP